MDHENLPRDILLDVLNQAQKPIPPEELAKRLHIEPEAFARFANNLVERGLLARAGGDRVVTPEGRAETGYVSTQARKGLIIVPDDRQLPFVNLIRGGENGAIVGDHVLFSYRHATEGRKGKSFRSNRSLKLEGQVLDILKERPNVVAGVYDIDTYGKGYLELRGKDKPRRVSVEIGPGQKSPSPGELVRVELERRPGARGSIGRFVEVVSDITKPDQDAETIAALYDFATDFSPEIIAELDQYPDDPREESMQGRLDLRDRTVLTIDPADAKDHDDAFSVERLDDGLIRVGVHIADVSHYVTPNSLLDQEAYERGTSVYLPGKTVPMLPKKLSAGLCSLMDGRVRLAKSCFMTIDQQGRVIRREIYDSIVNVHRFLNYGEAQGILDGRVQISPKVDQLVKDAREAADRLHAKRMAGGSVVLSIARPHLVLDDMGEIAKIEVETSDPAHNLIEELMLAANCSVASFLEERNLPILMRVHPEPDAEADEEFAEFCVELGAAAPNFADGTRVQAFLDGLKGRAGESAIHLAVLKSMKRAIYSNEFGFHYALGFDLYTHFTSPIRRLCDLVVHQVLSEYLANGGILKWESSTLDLPWMDGAEKPSDKKQLDGSKLKSLRSFRVMMAPAARQATESEVRAQRAEIEATQLKLLRSMLDRIGDEFSGTISHIGNAGVVVQLDEYWVEGTLFFFDLSDDWITPRKFWVEYETRRGAKKLMVGDTINVVVADVDLATRTMKLLEPDSPMVSRLRQDLKSGNLPEGAREAEAFPQQSSGKQFKDYRSGGDSGGESKRKGYPKSGFKPGTRKKKRGPQPKGKGGKRKSGGKPGGKSKGGSKGKRR